MPEIARFYGIIIRMFYDEHNPPHIHVTYNDDNAVFNIKKGILSDGKLPNKAVSMVKEWLSIYKDELLDMWEEQSIKELPPLE